MIAASKAYEVGLVKIKPIKDLVDERNIYLVTSKLSTECQRMKEYFDFIVENSRVLFDEYYKMYLKLQ
jgi:hypothetical protein